MLFIGIDPGKSGAIAVIDSDGNPLAPEWYVKCSETEHDVSMFLQSVVANGSVKACIEQVHSMPRQGVKSMFTFGQSYGFLRGFIVAQNVPFIDVTPRKWQQAMKCQSGGDKKVTKAAAQRLWPHLGKKITHANADALLIAEYLRRSDK